MNAFGYGFVSLMALSGWLAWRGTHRFVRALYAGLFAPLIALIVFGGFVGRPELQAMDHLSIFVGIVVVLAGLVFAFRDD